MNKVLKSIKHYYRVKKSDLREKKKSKKRSSQWDETRDLFISLNPICAACGSNEKLQVHHILPFNHYPELELELKNLITLCMGTNECHLNLGHCDNFRLYNPNIVIDAKLFNLSNNEQRELIKEHIKKEYANNKKAANK